MTSRLPPEFRSRNSLNSINRAKIARISMDCIDQLAIKNRWQSMTYYHALK